MKRLYVLTIVIFQVNCHFFSLLKEFDMKNPVIVGTIDDLKKNKMFDLMKNIMYQNQSICVTTDIKNGTIQQSPGIILNENKYKNLDALNINIRKPWLIVGTKLEKYSQINEPVYVLDNEILWERFQFKTFMQENTLGVIQGKEFKWNNNTARNFLERRGNFKNLTLRGMTETFANTVVLHKEWKNIARISNDIRNTYEVSHFNYGRNYFYISMIIRKKE